MICKLVYNPGGFLLMLQEWFERIVLSIYFYAELITLMCWSSNCAHQMDAGELFCGLADM